jgi:hypothetical protein
MIIPGSTYIFGVTQTNTDQTIIDAVPLVNANSTTRLELLIRNTGQATITAKLWQSADGITWTQLKNIAGSNSSAEVSPGGQGTFVGVVTLIDGYIKATGNADLSAITIPKTSADPESGGLITPRAGGNAKFLGNSRDPMGN